MSLTLQNHRLAGPSEAGKDVTWAPSPNHNGVIKPRYLVFHYTASGFAPARAQFLRGTGDGRTSAHLLVDVDGSVTQFVDLNLRAWHAGESSWKSLTDLNTWSIGIEVVNFGYLLKSGTGQYLAWTHDEVPPERVVEARHKQPQVPYQYWQAYTPEQVATCTELACLLANAYALDDVLGHEDIAPGRKTDPGPAFPLTSIRGRAIGRNAEAAGGEFIYVGVPKLNIRSGPGVGNAAAGSALAQGTGLSVIERRDGWVHVSVLSAPPVDGWVFEAYTRTSPLPP
jgi:N-acetylmuramoyl-L-alanine amidase